VARLDRITTDPAICHGQPTIRRLRYTVDSVLELLAAGMTIDEVLADYPDLERDDILAALEFGALNQAGHDAVHDHRAARILRPLPQATVATAAPAVCRFIPLR
jgi:uncharacterized protein (DUF433 family)